MSRVTRIKKLKSLVDDLSDRDIQLKLDARLFEDFFINFPIPVTIWSLDENGEILSKRGNTIVKDCGTCIKNMFLEEYSEDFKKYHSQAYGGKNVAFFSKLKDNTYYTRLVPRMTELGKIIGVSGISWDITNSYNTLDILKNINEESNNKIPNTEKIKKLSSKAIEISTIGHLADNGGKNE
jgi:hypothetical protein